jgi:glutamyl-tRNA synthetase
MEVRVRYAPSPTGLQHIGSVRTALINYLFSKSVGGTFILRIEDTDQARSTQEFVTSLYEAFGWLGVKWDEGPDVGGPVGPYIQSVRSELYRAHASELVEKGMAYPCFCDSKRLEAMRKAQEESKSGSGYDRHCRSIPADEAKRRMDSGESCVVRLKIPLDEVTRFTDLLLGDIEWKNADVSPDPVLLKSDGLPTYHLANVVDDHLMGITHVLRGQDWIPSTPLHVILYKGFGWDYPLFCHLPLVMGPDGHKLSKRHGSVSMEEFRAQGYLPEALINYVAMLGASYEEGRDLYSLEEMASLFSIEKLNKAPAVFDYKKLEWFNGQYIRLKADDELLRLVMPYAVEAGLFGEPGREASAGDIAKLARAIPLVKERIFFLKDASPMMAYLFKTPAIADKGEFIPKKLDAARAAEYLRTARKIVGQLAKAPEEDAEALARSTAESMGAKMGDFLMPLRVAITGTRVSPPLMGSIRILGEEESGKRIEAAISLLES